jgi:hypothetical protein
MSIYNNKIGATKLLTTIIKPTSSRTPKDLFLWPWVGEVMALPHTASSNLKPARDKIGNVPWGSIKWTHSSQSHTWWRVYKMWNQMKITSFPWSLLYRQRHQLECHKCFLVLIWDVGYCLRSHLGYQLLDIYISVKISIRQPFAHLGCWLPDN